MSSLPPALNYVSAGNLKRPVSAEDEIKNAMTWTGRLQQFAPALSATEIDPVVDFLKRGLRLEPSARATAAQLLEDPWLRNHSPTQPCLRNLINILVLEAIFFLRSSELREKIRLTRVST